MHRRDRVLGIAIGVLAIGFVITFTAFRWGTFTPEDWNDRFDFARNLAIVAGGTGALVVAYWRTQIANHELNVAKEQVATQKRTLLNERHTRALAQMKSTELADRISGISELSRLASEEPEMYHIIAMKDLCYFIRFPPSAMDTKNIRDDVQRAVWEIGNRNGTQLSIEKINQYTLDLQEADLSRAQLMQLKIPSAALGRANLSASYLQGADISKADLTGAILHHAELSQSKCISTAFMDADLSQATLARADCSGALFYGAVLNGANLHNAIFHRAVLTRADFTDARLSGVDLSGAIFSQWGHDDEVVGLTQRQLDQAYADPNNPPIIVNAKDAETGEILIWDSKVTRRRREVRYRLQQQRPDQSWEITFGQTGALDIISDMDQEDAERSHEQGESENADEIRG